MVVRVSLISHKFTSEVEEVHMAVDIGKEAPQNSSGLLRLFWRVGGYFKIYKGNSEKYKGIIRK